jgi:ATP-binding cassette subfamily F protein 3
MPEKQVRSVIGAFGFSGDDSSKQCKVLSGGEKIRLCFARIFVNPPNFLILDEPTTHLDIAAREALQQSLKAYAGTVCMVSHDVEFLRGAADVILEVRGHKVTRYGGDYDYYRERIALQETEELKPKKQEIRIVDNQKERRKERALRRQELSKEKKRLETAIARIEKHLEEAEKEKAEIEEELATPGIVTDFSAKQRRLSELYVDIAADTEAWDKESTALAALLEEYEAIE